MTAGEGGLRLASLAPLRDQARHPPRALGAGHARSSGEKDRRRSGASQDGFCRTVTLGVLQRIGAPPRRDTKAGNGRARRVWIEARGPIAIPRRPRNTFRRASMRCRNRFKPSAGRPRCGCASAFVGSPPAAHIRTWRSRRSRANGSPSCERLRRRSRSPVGRSSLGTASRCGPGFRATLDDVKRRLRPILVPRVRQARDGPQYGGTQSTDISRINRRSYWLISALFRVTSSSPRSIVQRPNHDGRRDYPAACADRWWVGSLLGGLGIRLPVRSIHARLTNEVISTPGFSRGALRP